NLMSVDCDDQIATYGNRNIADVCALIATAQAGVFRGPAGQHLNDEQARISGQAHLVSKLWGDGNRANPQRRAAHAAERDQVIQYRLRSVNRDGKTDTGALPNTRGDQSIDARSEEHTSELQSR